MVDGAVELHAGTVLGMDDFETQRLLTDQAGVLSRVQALSLGMTLGRVRAQVDASRWERRGRGVLSTTTGLLSDRAQLHAVLLALRSVAALSHDTAAREWGMTSWREPPPTRWHATVPYGASARGHPDIDVHRSRAFAHIVVEKDGLLLVSAAHTVLDLALAAPDARTAMRVFLTAATAGSVPVSTIREAVELRGVRRFRRAILDAIRLLEQGVTSVLEARYVMDVERAHGLPEAVRQFPTDVDGTTLFEDCLYRCPRGEAIVRLDGSTHARRAVRLRDRRRGNAAELAGRACLVFGWEEVAGAPCESAREVFAVLEHLGRTEAFVHCSACEHFGLL